MGGPKQAPNLTQENPFDTLRVPAARLAPSPLEAEIPASLGATLPSIAIPDHAKRFMDLARAVGTEKEDLTQSYAARDAAQRQRPGEAYTWWQAQAEKFRIEARLKVLERFEAVNPSLALEGRMIQECFDRGDIEKAKLGVSVVNRRLFYPSALYRESLDASRRADVDALVADPAFAALAPAGRLEAVRTAALASPAVVRNMKEMIHSPQIRQLSEADQAKLLHFADNIREEGLPALNHLLTTTDRTGTSLLLQRDFSPEKKTLLDNLVSSRSALPHPELKTTWGNYLTEVMQEIDHYRGQGNRGTCPIAVVRYFLSFHNPSEYARQAVGLGSSAGEVSLASGAKFRASPDGWKPDDSGRSTPARTYETAGMEKANGPKVYSNQFDNQYDQAAGKFIGSGLTSTEAKGFLEDTFNKKFTMPQATPGQQEFLDEIRGIIADVITRPERTMCMVALKNSSPEPGLHANHAFSIYEMGGGRIYLVNPWGPTNQPKGTELPDWGIRVENPQQGTYSISEAEFSKRFAWMLFPPADRQTESAAPEERNTR